MAHTWCAVAVPLDPRDRLPAAGSWLTSAESNASYVDRGGRQYGLSSTAKNFQLDLFDPNDGYYEYSAVASNLPLTIRNLWHFMGGRGNHEKTMRTNAYAANSAWQQLVALAHNLLTNFQIDTGVEERTRSRKHTVLHLHRTVQTLRFEIFHRAAILMRPGGITQLRLTNNATTRHTFTRIEKALTRAA